MGIIDMLAEKARQEQAAAAAPPAPAVIPAGTPTPAVTSAAIQADRQARKEAAELARVNPEAAMAGVQVVSAPPEPKLIPVGTPSPAVTPEQVAADQEARRLEMEAAKAKLAGSSATTAPAAALITPEAAIETPIEQVPPIAQQVQATPPEQEEAAFAAGQSLVPEQSTVGLPVEPTFAEKLSTVAKKRGRGFLDALQAGLYNFAGITKPTDYEKRIEAEATEKKDLLDKQWQAQMTQIGQDFQARQAAMDRDFSIMVAKAKNDWDVQVAKEAHQQQSAENVLDRQSAMQRVTAQNQQQKQMTMDQIKQLITSTYGGQ
ncbi:MAG TPA: hypothetical protein VJ553_05360 [Candidatus Paceibacterota bacterium]|nr:hypothetical protein [Candidatus Paceibacterota bacterium]